MYIYIYTYIVPTYLPPLFQEDRKSVPLPPIW